jgi:hypothetical protein
VPAFPPLAVLAGWGAADLSRRVAPRAVAVAALSAALVGTAGASAAAADVAIDNARYTTRLQRERHAVVGDVELDNAAVILRSRRPSHLLTGYPFLINDPRLSGDVVYALDVGPRTTEIAALVPDRDLFHLVLRAPANDVLHPRDVIEPVRLLRGPDVTLRFRARPPAGRRFVFVYVAVHGRPADEATLAPAADGGDVGFSVVLDGPTFSARRPSELRARVTEDASVSVGVGFSRDDDPEHAEWFMRDFNVSVGDADDRDVRVLTPGLENRLYPSPVWAPEDIGHRLAEDHDP